MKTRNDPTRSAEQRGAREVGSDQEERALIALFEKAGDPEPLTSAELGTVLRRLSWSGDGHQRRRARELVMICAALLSGVGVAFGGLGLVEWSRGPADESGTSSESAVSRPLPARAAERRRGIAPAPVGAEEELEPPVSSDEDLAAPEVSAKAPEPSAEAAAPAVASVRSESTRGAAPVARATGVTPATPAPAGAGTPEAPSALSNESTALAGALVALRRDRDPRRALSLLDGYEAEYPRGLLRMEAKVTRVHALLALGEKARAESLLSSLPLDGAAGAELKLLRAELAAERNCSSALRDLDVLIRTAPAVLAERALHTRAHCLARSGDRAGAARDAAAYLQRFPNGRFASAARTLVPDSASGGAGTPGR